MNRRAFIHRAALGSTLAVAPSSFEPRTAEAIPTSGRIPWKSIVEHTSAFARDIAVAIAPDVAKWLLNKAPQNAKDAFNDAKDRGFSETTAQQSYFLHQGTGAYFFAAQDPYQNNAIVPFTLSSNNFYQQYALIGGPSIVGLRAVAQDFAGQNMQRDLYGGWLIPISPITYQGNFYSFHESWKITYWTQYGWVYMKYENKLLPTRSASGYGNLAIKVFDELGDCNLLSTGYNYQLSYV